MASTSSSSPESNSSRSPSGSSSSSSSSASPASSNSSTASNSSSASASTCPSSSSSSSTSSSSSSNVTAFLSKLWRLVNEQNNNDLITWSQSGCSFVILNQIQFAKDLLPLYFKHSNMASFIRQLNMYGFRKIPIVSSNGSTEQRTDLAQFYHVNFMRGQEQRLASIKRKNNTSRSHNLIVNGTFCDEVRSILSDVKSIRDGQNSSESILGAIQVDNKSLWRDVAILRSQHHKQRRVIEKLIQFLLSLIQNRNNFVSSKKRKVRLMISNGTGPNASPSSSGFGSGSGNCSSSSSSSSGSGGMGGGGGEAGNRPGSSCNASPLVSGVKSISIQQAQQQLVMSPQSAQHLVSGQQCRGSGLALPYDSASSPITLDSPRVLSQQSVQTLCQSAMDQMSISQQQQHHGRNQQQPQHQYQPHHQQHPHHLNQQQQQQQQQQQPQQQQMAAQRNEHPSRQDSSSLISINGLTGLGPASVVGLPEEIVHQVTSPTNSIIHSRQMSSQQQYMSVEVQQQQPHQGEYASQPVSTNDNGCSYGCGGSYGACNYGCLL